MKPLVLLIVVLLCVPLVIAQNSTLGEDISTVIVPPSFPSDEPGIILTLQLKSFSSRSTVGNIHVLFTVEDLVSMENFSTIRYVDQDGVLQLMLKSSSFRLILRADDISTPGKDYYVVQDVNLRSNLTLPLYLAGVGSVRGKVVDASGSAIPNVPVKPECVSSAGDLSGTTTDNIGFYNLDWLPSGSCVISSISGGVSGSKEVTVVPSSLQTVDILLMQKVKGSVTGFAVVLIAFIIIISILFILLRSRVPRGKSDTRDSKLESQERHLNVSGRQRDILKTLNDKERQIVEFLISHENRANQSKLRYELAIPKTSLVRILQGLQLKNIVRIEQAGKLKKVYLTNFFLGKE
jgi:uncharacterized membrane protein